MKVVSLFKEKTVDDLKKHTSETSIKILIYLNNSLGWQNNQEKEDIEKLKEDTNMIYLLMDYRAKLPFSKSRQGKKIFKN